MQNVMKAMRHRVERMNTERALRHLDDHLLEDIGLPPRNRRRSFGSF